MAKSFGRAGREGCAPARGERCASLRPGRQPEQVFRSVAQVELAGGRAAVAVQVQVERSFRVDAGACLAGEADLHRRDGLARARVLDGRAVEPPTAAVAAPGPVTLHRRGRVLVRAAATPRTRVGRGHGGRLRRRHSRRVRRRIGDRGDLEVELELAVDLAHVDGGRRLPAAARRRARAVRRGAHHLQVLERLRGRGLHPLGLEVGGIVAQAPEHHGLGRHAYGHPVAGRAVAVGVRARHVQQQVARAQVEVDAAGRGDVSDLQGHDVAARAGRGQELGAEKIGGVAHHSLLEVVRVLQDMEAAPSV
jgi:hypothetical protein